MRPHFRRRARHDEIALRRGVGYRSNSATGKMARQPEAQRAPAAAEFQHVHAVANAGPLAGDAQGGRLGLVKTHAGLGVPLLGHDERVGPLPQPGQPARPAQAHSAGRRRPGKYPPVVAGRHPVFCFRSHRLVESLSPDREGRRAGPADGRRVRDAVVALRLVELGVPRQGANRLHVLQGWLLAPSDRRNKDRPFFLYHPSQLPHGPTAVPEVHVGLQHAEGLSRWEKEYASMALLPLEVWQKNRNTSCRSCPMY